MRLITYSARETEQLGKLLGREVVKSKLLISGALVIALYGNLGAGKTVFAKGFVCGVDAIGKVTSPTFLIVRRFPLRKNRARVKNLFHVDVYRIKRKKELYHIDFESMLADRKNIVIVEWPSKVRTSLPKSFLKITLRHRKKENEREVVFSVIIK